MWISKQYYKRLLATLTLFSEGNFEFDEEELECFRSNKYLELTKLLQEIRDSSNNNIETSLTMLENIEAGVSSKEGSNLGFKGDYAKLESKYNQLLDYLEQVTSSSKDLKSILLDSGNINLKYDSMMDLKNLNGFWLENAITLNQIAEYSLENISEINHLLNSIDEITMVLTAVAKGDLTQKITYDFNSETLDLKKTINKMVTQLAEIVSEITRVAMEVGTDGILGGQAKVHNASGTWLDLTNNINKMSKSLAEFDRENKDQNWIKDGISILSKEILYEDSILEQFHIAITQLCRYINAGRGVLYFYNSILDELELVSSYAYENISNSNKTIQLGEGLIGQAAKDRQTICFNKSCSNTVIKTATAEYNIKNTYIAPLVYKDRLIGVIEIASFYDFTDIQLEFLENAVSVLAGSFYTSIQIRNNKKLELISKTDALTGLNNRGYFNQIMPEILSLEKRNNGLINFAIFDIDHFKNFNDTYGHDVGDLVLQRVSSVIKRSLKREEDYCFRIGGEEFAAIFNTLDKEKAFNLMTEIKDEVEALNMTDKEGNELNKITISIGLVCEKATQIKNVESLFKKADNLLYKAKRGGRNMIKTN